VSTESFDRQPSAALIKPSDHITSGFEIVPAVLDQRDIAGVAASLEEGLERSRAGARHLMRHAIVQQVARDPRLVALASRFLGPSAIPFRATLFDKSPDHNWLVVWHQDTALPLRERRDVSGWGSWSVKAGITYAHAPAATLSRVIALRLHIDDSCPDNGPLRVLPGTHTQGVMSDAEVMQLARDVHAVDCVCPSGGVVAMRPLLVHASSKAGTDQRRRVLHIEYAESLRVGDELELAIA
jgi:ectoine hydroxylase-related dioxygenase (phytanoyl-CoA dioxygenase family)